MSVARKLPRRRGALLVIALLAACQPADVPPTASGPTTGDAASTAPIAPADPAFWTRIQPHAIEQPFGFEVVHTDGNGNPVSMCAPCHPGVDTTMTGVAGGPAGFVAVGWIFQGFHGVAWHSADGSTWAMDGQLAENTILSAVAADSHRYVAVGLNGKGATAWSSTDGVAWQQTPSADAFAAIPLRLTSVVRWSGGFAAAGYEGSEFGSATAAFWISADGVTWRRAPASAQLADARAWSIASGDLGLVAVGTSGPADAPGPVVVWTSPDGLNWTRVPDTQLFAGARARTIASVPRIGFVVAGETLAGDIGVVWTSPDGISWTRAPAVPDLGRPGIQVRLFAAIAGGPGAVIVGTATEGSQYGESVVWTSPDGISWTRQKSSAEFSDGELTAVAPWGSGLVAVGDRGEPDAYIATVWLSPPAGLH